MAYSTISYSKALYNYLRKFSEEHGNLWEFPKTSETLQTRFWELKRLRKSLKNNWQSSEVFEKNSETVQNGFKMSEKSSEILGSVCDVGTVGKISDCQPEGPSFKPRPGRGLNFGRPSFATPSVDRDVKALA